MLVYQDIKGELIEEIANDRRAQRLIETINTGAGTYNTASEYAIRVGDCLGRVLRRHAPFENISEWNIEDLIPQSLGLNHAYVSNACKKVQEVLIADAGLSINFLEPEFDGNRAYGIVEELRSHPEFTSIEATFYDQLVNFSQNVVDQAIRTNGGVLNRAGVRSKVIRSHEFKACDWCQEVSGEYDYDEVKGQGNDVWRRHENCRCTIDFITERNGNTYQERVNNQRRVSNSSRGL